jgi:hypothetical protein
VIVPSTQLNTNQQPTPLLSFLTIGQSQVLTSLSGMPIRPGAIACLLLASVAVSLAHHQIRAVHSAFDFEEAARQESARRRPTASEAVHPGPGLHHDYAVLFNAKSRRDLPIRRRLQLELSLRQTLRIDLKTFMFVLKECGLQCGLRM